MHNQNNNHDRPKAFSYKKLSDPTLQDDLRNCDPKTGGRVVIRLGDGSQRAVKSISEKSSANGFRIVETHADKADGGKSRKFKVLQSIQVQSWAPKAEKPPVIEEVFGDDDMDDEMPYVQAKVLYRPKVSNEAQEEHLDDQKQTG